MEQKTIIKLLKTSGITGVGVLVIVAIAHFCKKDGGGSLINIPITYNNYNGATNCGNSGK